MSNQPKTRHFGPRHLPTSRKGATLGDVGGSKDIQVALGLLIASVLVGALNVKLRTQLPWIASPPPADATACQAEAFGAPSDTMRRISVQELADRLTGPNAQPTLLVDARAGIQYTQGHIPGATSLPAFVAPDLLQVQSLAIRPDIPVVTYCDGGECELSESLAILLQEDVGCTEVMVLEGGFAAWQQAGLPSFEGELPGSWPGDRESRP